VSKEPVREEPAAAAEPADRFEDLVDDLIGTAGVTPPRGGSGFGRALKHVADV
jgi:hypothetical protein